MGCGFRGRGSNVRASQPWSVQSQDSTFHAVITVPIGVCRQRIFGVSRICAVRLWSVLEMFRVGRICAVLWCFGVFVVVWWCFGVLVVVVVVWRCFGILVVLVVFLW